ncbi:hypothetical protein E2C01_009305 [Portunus trituberculatus]|uniref:Uncharacterized protein n=1 Tax=Portunus trituberculatus TaxID=210409 RepID=A0A5B7D4T5_PORTR|nr:hypothetical protein [Portunus trituberculatus]
MLVKEKRNITGDLVILSPVYSCIQASEGIEPEYRPATVNRSNQGAPLKIKETEFLICNRHSTQGKAAVTAALSPSSSGQPRGVVAVLQTLPSVQVGSISPSRHSYRALCQPAE